MVRGDTWTERIWAARDTGRLRTFGAADAPSSLREAGHRESNEEAP